jgi:hypothetical protein
MHELRFLAASDLRLIHNSRFLEKKQKLLKGWIPAIRLGNLREDKIKTEVYSQARLEGASIVS